MTEYGIMFDGDTLYEDTEAMLAAYHHYMYTTDRTQDSIEGGTDYMHLQAMKMPGRPIYNNGNPPDRLSKLISAQFSQMSLIGCNAILAMSDKNISTKDEHKLNQESKLPYKRCSSVCNDDVMASGSRQKIKKEIITKEDDHKRHHESILHSKQCSSVCNDEVMASWSIQEIKKEVIKKQNWEIDLYLDPVLANKYHEYSSSLLVGPNYICTCCERLLFQSSVKPISCITLDKNNEKFIINHIQSVDNIEWLCMSCINSLSKFELPPQAVANDLNLDEVPECFHNITPLEKNLISMRIGFRKIIECPSGGQKKLRGQIINVPANIQAVCNVFPRMPVSGEVFKVGIKGSRDYTKTYMSDCVDVHRVNECLIYLKNNNQHYQNIEIRELTAHGNLDICIPALGDENYEVWKTAYETYIDRMLGCISQKFSDICPDVFLKFGHILKNNTLGTCTIPIDNNMLYSTFLMSINDDVTLPGVIRTRVNRFLNTTKGYYEGAVLNEELSESFLIYDPVSKKEIQLIPGVNRDILKISDLSSLRIQAWSNYMKLLYRGLCAGNICAHALSLLYNVDIIIYTLSGVIEYSTATAEKKISMFMIKEGLYYPLLYENGRWVNEVNNLCDKLSEQEDIGDVTNDDYYEELVEIGQDSCIQRQNISVNDDSIIFYPTVGNQPKSVFSDSLFEVLSNPDKFPNGTGGYHDWYRSRKITMKQYIKQRLENRDNRFRLDTDYLFSAQFAVEAEQLLDNIKIALRKIPGRTYQGKKVDASFFLNQENVEDLCDNSLAYRIFSNVRGSQPFWDSVYASSCSCIRQLGSPTWFFTLSAAETRWPELIKILAGDVGKNVSLEQASKMSWAEKCHLINNNPVLVARYFNQRVRKFMNDVILTVDGPLGHITDYIYRIEFQLRGAPHLHAVLYDKNHDSTVERSYDDIVEYVGKYQSCELPVDESFRELVQSRMIHVHNKTCTGRQNSCRFDFPRWPLKETIITRREGESTLTNVADYNKIRRVFVKSLKLVSKMNTIDEFLELLGVNYQDYVQLIKDHYRGSSVLIKRGIKEIWVNVYNPIVLKLWRANMDVQYILNPYACMKYITSYMLKSEKGTSNMLRTIQETYKSASFKILCKKMATAWFLNRQVGAQECAFRALSMPLKFCSRQTVYVDSRVREHRHAIVVKKDKLLDMGEDSDYLETNIMDYYAKRTNTLENKTLADMASEYNLVSVDPVFFKKRKLQAILRYFLCDPLKFPLMYLQSTLLLHLPWRDETIFEKGLPDLKIIYDLNKESIELNRSKFCKIDQTKLDEIMVNVKIEIRRQYDEPCNDNEVENDTNYFEDSVDLIGKSCKNSMMFRCNIDQKNTRTYDKRPVLMTKREYDEAYLTLNTEQRQLVDYCRSWCIDHVYYSKQGLDHEPFNICLTGQAGVGKSYCLKMIVHDIYKYLPLLDKYSRDDQLVLILAPTGSAAYTVDGVTMHSGLSIEIDVTKFKPLNSEKLAEYQRVCKNLMFVIMDEISMVPDVNFHKSSMRLQQIKDSPTNVPFGGVNMICCGDFLQLSPVNSGYCFNTYTGKLNFTCDDIWWPYFKKFQLTVVQRQRDERFKLMLSRVRLGKMTSDDIELLESRDIKNLDDDIPLDTLHVFLTRGQVQDHNLHCMTQLQRTRPKMYFVTACVPGGYGEPACVVADIKICVDIPIILSRNIDVKEGLVNGCRGKIKHIVLDPDNNVSTILLEFSNPNIGQKYKLSSHWKVDFPNCVPLIQLGITGYDYTREDSFIFTGKFFPFFLGWATTIHKVQGLTIDKLVVSFSRPKPKKNKSSRAKFVPGQAYVALSRVKTIDGLYLIDFNEHDIISNDIPQKTVQMLPNLVNIDNIVNMYIDTAFLNIRGYTSNANNLLDYLEVNLSDQISVCFVIEANCKVRNPIRLGDRWEIKMGMEKNKITHTLCVFKLDYITNMSLIELDFVPNSYIDLWKADVKGCEPVYYLTIYKMVDQSLDLITQDITNALNFIKNYHEFRIYILGDLNLNTSSVGSKQLVDLIINNGYATYLSGSTTIYGTSIDYLFCNQYISDSKILTKKVHFTDHHMILFPSTPRC